MNDGSLIDPSAAMAARFVGPDDPGPDISVVIGYRDWGAERLRLSLKAHRAAVGDLSCEIVISDYGSRDPSVAQGLAAEYGARVIHTPVDGVWNRSRCLNIGVAAARSDCVVTTDTDMLFRPPTLSVILNAIRATPQAVHLLQCKNLPPEYDERSIIAFDWDEFERVSFFRPRWGMGGLAGFSRSLLFSKLGGYDERMEVYGAEDTDLGERLQRAGFFMNWIDEPSARIFHIWHEPTLNTIRRNKDDVAALERNRKIYMSDKSFVRNTTMRSQGLWGRPLCSVLMTTRNRPQFLAAAIRSVLSQTVQDFEIVVIDDGSDTDAAGAICKEFDDPRIRYVPRPRAGVGAARNYGLGLARADWIVIHDDDDLMLPTRLERHFDTLEAGMVGTYGGWIDFEQETGALTFNAGKAFSYDSVAFGARALVHGSMMLHREVLARCRYSETLPFTIDYNMVLQVARAGYRLGHTGHYAILRRVHDQSVTAAFSADQRHLTNQPIAILGNEITAAEQARRREAAKTLPAAVCANHGATAYFRQFLAEEFEFRESFLVWRWLPPHTGLTPARFLASVIAGPCFARSFDAQCVFPPKGGAHARFRVVGGRAQALDMARALESISGAPDEAAVETEGRDSYGAPIWSVGKTNVERRFTPAEDVSVFLPLPEAAIRARPKVTFSGDEAVLHLSVIKAEIVTAFLEEAARAFTLLRYATQDGIAPRRHGFAFAMPSDHDKSAFLRVARAHFPNARAGNSQRCA